MAKNTDDIATQLAVLKYVKIFDIDGAVAEAEIQERIKTEQEKAAQGDIAQSAESGEQSVSNAGETVIGNDAQVKYSIANTLDMSWEDQLKKSKRSDTLVASKNTPSYLIEKGVSDKPLAIPKSIVTKAQSGKDESHSISNQNIRNLPKGINNAIAVIDDKKRNSIIFITNLKEKGKPIIVSMQKDASFDGDDVHQATSIHARQNVQAYLQKFDADSITVLKQNEFDALSRNDTHNGVRVQEGEKPVGAIITQTEPVVNTEGEKNITKHDLAENGEKTVQEAREVAENTEAQKGAEDGTEKKGDGKAAQKSSEAKEKSSESKKAQAQSGKPKISEAKESLTDEQRKENARKRAEQMIEYEKANAPTVKELNTLREYVKGFDQLSQARKASIVRMIRSAEGKVDTKIIRGLANLMAITPKADLEIRFAEGIGDGGLYTHAGNKALILLDPSANYKDSIKGTIAHELVHYIENKAGYKDFADYVMKRVKPERRAEVEKLYNERYTEIYTEEAKKQGLDAEGIKKYVADKMATEEYKALVESEIVAKYVGQALNNEKLLKKYADKDKKFIARVGEWLVQKVKAMKNKNLDAETVKIAEDMAFRVSVLLQDPRMMGESKGETKYDTEAKKKITIGMSDSDRAEVLKKTKLEVVEFNDETATLSDKEVLKLKDTYKSQAEKIVRNLAKKFGVFADYSNENIDLEFNYSGRSLGESVHKQNDRVLDKSHADFYDFAKMLCVFDDIVRNAQPIEAHSDKYIETKRANSNLKQTYILLSAFEDGTSIIPVEFNIKEFANGDKNKLYVSVTLQKIEVDLMEHPPQRKVATKNSKPTSTYSITDILKNVNPRDKYFLKYIPDSLLNIEQISAKNDALEEDRIRLEDMRYEFAVENNPEKAVEMLSAKAKAEGYIADSETGIVYKPGNNNFKTTEITYDDKGNLIPISKRYDENVADVRYDLDETRAKSKTKAEVLDENGEVRDEYFAAAVERSFGTESSGSGACEGQRRA